MAEALKRETVPAGYHEGVAPFKAGSVVGCQKWNAQNAPEGRSVRRPGLGPSGQAAFLRSYSAAAISTSTTVCPGSGVTTTMPAGVVIVGGVEVFKARLAFGLARYFCTAAISEPGSFAAFLRPARRVALPTAICRLAGRHKATQEAAEFLPLRQEKSTGKPTKRNWAGKGDAQKCAWCARCASFSRKFCLRA